MISDESYQPNLDDNRGAAEQGIYCKETDIYAWVFLPTTQQVSNKYISELIGLYEI